MEYRRIRILHVLHSFSAGGLENGIVNIINNSPDYLEHELCLLTGCGDFVNRLNRPLPVHELHKRGGNDARVIALLHSLYRRERIDIIHTRNWAGFDGVMAACLNPSCRVIHGEHGRDISDPDGLKARRNRLRRFMQFRVWRYVAVSRNLYEWLENRVGIKESKMLYIPNGVDSEKFHPQRCPDLRKELGIDEGEFVIGTVGRLDPVKNHEGLIDAVERLNRKTDGIRLVIVGDGPNRGALESKLRSVSISPAPILPGYRADAHRFYGLFDVFVLPSFAEGMSNTLLEAMASGMPIICTPVGGNLDLVANGVSGRIVPCDDPEAIAQCILEYRDSPSERERHGKNARALAQGKYSLKTMVSSYVSLYESAMTPQHH